MSALFTVVNPPELGKPRGFAHGLITPAGGRLLFVAGQIGTDAALVGSDAFTAQFERALARVGSVVRAAGGQPEHIVRMTVYVTSMDRYRESRAPLRDVWRRHLGSHYPAMSLVEVSALFDKNARVEIEATAVLP
jgi:enamine deaminase RidA (YjgF/YER057c/UK114 family)